MKSNQKFAYLFKYSFKNPFNKYLFKIVSLAVFASVTFGTKPAQADVEFSKSYTPLKESKLLGFESPSNIGGNTEKYPISLEAHSLSKAPFRGEKGMRFTGKFNNSLDMNNKPVQNQSFYSEEEVACIEKQKSIILNFLKNPRLQSLLDFINIKKIKIDLIFSADFSMKKSPNKNRKSTRRSDLLPLGSNNEHELIIPLDFYVVGGSIRKTFNHSGCLYKNADEILEDLVNLAKDQILRAPETVTFHLSEDPSRVSYSSSNLSLTGPSSISSGDRSKSIQEIKNGSTNPNPQINTNSTSTHAK